mgnify:FL=1
MVLGTTPCGLSYAVRKAGYEAGYCALSIRCGTRDEEGFHGGIAHFTEHTIFRGTKTMSASRINSRLDSLGGDLNAYTTKEEIVLHATVLKEDLPKAVALLLELASSPTFPDDEIETERGVVLDEIISSKDSPSDDVFDRFEELLFGKHPLGRPILGTSASVRRITPEELRRFVGKFFLPERMVLTVCSPVEEEKMEKEVRKLIGRYFGGNAVPDTVRPVLSRPEGIYFDKVVDKRNHEVNAVIGTTGPSLYDGKDRIAAALLSNILGGPASNSLLGSVLREKNGWVYGVDCSYTQYADTGVVAIAFGCDRENLEKCLGSTRRILDSLSDKPLSERKLKAARKQFLGQMAIASELGEARCLSMGKGLLSFGRIASFEETVRDIEEVSSEDLRALAARLFPPSRMSRLIYL